MPQLGESKMEVKCSYDKLVPIGELKPHPKNPNKHSESQIARLSQIIDYQGMRSPVIVSRLSGFVVVGHGRLEAAKKCGAVDIPVNYQEFKSEEQEYAHIVADNAIAEWANLDLESIKAEANGFEDFDLELLAVPDLNINEVIEKVNAGDENSEWVGMPEFKEGEDYIRLSYFFGSEESRDAFIEKENIKVDMKRNKKNWICYK